MNMALFESMAGVKLQAVHYRGAAPALNDLAGGSINLMSVSVSLALPAFRGGRVKMLGIGSDKRLALASDIPTVAESGLPGYQAVTWFGLFGPAKLPPDIVGKLNTQVRKDFRRSGFSHAFPRAADVRGDAGLARRVRRLHPVRASQVGKSDSRR